MCFHADVDQGLGRPGYVAVVLLKRPGDQFVVSLHTQGGLKGILLADPLQDLAHGGGWNGSGTGQGGLRIEQYSYKIFNMRVHYYTALR